MNELVVIVLNYRTPAYTVDCLRSLAAEQATGFPFRVILVDNASGDDSVPIIGEAMQRHGWGSWVEFVVMKENLGFAGGNNAAMQRALAAEPPPSYVLLLNSDTLVHPGCLRHCRDRMEQEPSIGALSCMLQNRDGSVQNVARKFPAPWRETFRALGFPYFFPLWFGWADLEDKGWDRRVAGRDVDWIGGAFLMTRTDVLRKIGLLDDDFFFYGEDLEFCFRVWKAGYRVYFDPAATITHFGGASSDSTRMVNRRRDILTWKARFLTQRKCYGSLAEGWIRSMYIISFFGRRIWMAVSGKRETLEYQRTCDGLSLLIHPLPK